ncbi:MAG: F0F1 ATP synthase subunit B [Aggregatilineales bacterium]
MNEQSRSLRLLLLLLLLLSLIAVPAVMAQEEAAAEAETMATVEAAPAEEAVNPLVPLGINAGFLVAQIFNFLLLFGLLSIVLWRPLMNMLDSRAAKIQKGLEDAAAAANARRDAEAEAERIRAAARADVARMIEEARQRGEDLAKQIENEAQAEAEKIRAEARARANEERDRQLADLRGQVAAIAIAVSHRLIGESLDEKRQQALINDFFSKVPAEAKSLSGPVEVISAMPLDEAEQARVKQEIGVDQVTFSVDPSILGGLVIRTTDRVVDGSVRSGLTELAGLLR